MDDFKKTNNKCLIITFGPKHEKSWWWKWLDINKLNCELEYQRLSINNKKSSEISTFEIPCLAIKIVFMLLRARKSYEYIFTFECDWTSLIISVLQTFMSMRRPKHIILQFIMREKESNCKSRIKYLLMRYIFSSVYLCVCSSRSEIEYYKRVFEWGKRKLGFVPFHTDPEFLIFPDFVEDDYILSVGRTFRDYNTLIKAVTDTAIPTIIITSKKNSITKYPNNVRTIFDIGISDVSEYIARSRLVVLSLEEREISTGQSVLLHAMAMGKPVIVTKTNGTIDYIDHMQTGIFVEPNDVKALKDAINILYNDPSMRKNIGRNAKEKVKNKYLPMNYVENVANVLMNGVTN